MPELPWEKWYPTNWAAEPGLRQCEAATRGIWFEMVNTMMLHETYFVSGTVEELAALCVCRTPQMQLAIEQIKKFKVGDVREQKVNTTHENVGTNDEQTVNIIIECRKRKRDCNLSELRRKAGVASGTKRQHTPQQHVGTKPQHPSASASVYASASASASEPERGINPETFVVIQTRLNELYRQPNRRWPYEEEYALAEICRHPDAQKEFDIIIQYRTKLHEKRYFPQSVISVLNSWSKLLDAAAVYEPPKTPEEKKKMERLLAEWK